MSLCSQTVFMARPVLNATAAPALFYWLSQTYNPMTTTYMPFATNCLHWVQWTVSPLYSISNSLLHSLSCVSSRHSLGVCIQCWVHWHATAVCKNFYNTFCNMWFFLVCIYLYTPFIMNATIQWYRTYNHRRIYAIICYNMYTVFVL